MTENNRNPVIDICRGIGILLVIWGHALEMTVSQEPVGPGFTQWKTIYSFHVPLFFFISGTLHRPSQWSKTLTSALTLIFMAMATHIIGAIVAQLFDPMDVKRTARSLMTLQHFSIITTWYLVAQAWIIILAQLMESQRQSVRYAVVALLTGALIVNQALDRSIFQSQAVPMGLFFYWLGFVVHRRWLNSLYAMSTAMLSLLLLVTVALVISLAPMNHGCSFDFQQQCDDFRGHFGVMFVTGHFGYWPLFFLSSSLGIAASFICSGLLLRMRPALFSRFTSLIGKSTVDLLILNGIFLAFVQPAILRRFDVDASATSAILWPLGLTMVQIGLLPVARVPVASLRRYCQHTAAWIIHLRPAAISSLDRFLGRGQRAK